MVYEIEEPAKITESTLNFEMRFPSQCMPHAGSVHFWKMSTFIAVLLRSSYMHCASTFKIQQAHTLCVSALCTSAFVLAHVHTAKSSNKVLIASCGAVNDIFDSHLFWNCDGCKENPRNGLQTFQWLSCWSDLKRLAENNIQKWTRTVLGSYHVCSNAMSLHQQEGTHFMLRVSYCMLGPLPHSHLKVAVALLSVSPSKKVKRDGWGIDWACRQRARISTVLR